MGNEGSKQKGGDKPSGKGAKYAAKKEGEIQDVRVADADALLDEGIKRAPLKKVGKEDFDIQKTIGKGSFGRVFMVTKKDTGRVYAMKVLNKEKVIARNQLQHTLSERKILADIASPFLVGLRFAFQTTTKLFMVFDFFNGGELYSYISKGRFTEDRSRFYTAEIVVGLEALHTNNVVYRDLKPENLLLDASGHIKICDFGLSKEDVEGDTVKSICGTPEYLAPEVIRRQKYGKAVDWWSLGTLVWEMLVGLPPFYDTNRQKMYRMILDKPLVKHKLMSEQAFEVCQGLLTRTPERRLGYNGASEIKDSAWFSAIDWAKLEKQELEPPFKPEVKGAADTSAVDEVFTKEAAVISATAPDAKVLDGGEFENFTFVMGGQVMNVKEDADIDPADF